MNWYEQKQEEKRQRLEERAAKRRAEGQARYKSGMDRLKTIPFGQPMMPGHYSYKRDRNFREKAVGSIDKGIDLMKEADAMEARAENIGTGGISSDDPDAVVKLKAELVALEERQAAMKAENDEWRKAGNKAGRQPDGKWIDAPNPGFRLSNNSANIRRVQKRIEFLSRQVERPTTEQDEGGFKVKQNAEINRLQFIFPGKPSEAIRTILKRSGFRWSPSEGAWQRQLTGCAPWFIENITKSVKEAI